MAACRFPEGFLWGVATSAQQIEGASAEGGRSPSIWDRFASLPGAIQDGSTPATTCDHYHRWQQDIGLMRWLGAGAYRFSVSWSRVMPAGRGAPDARGLDFYERLVDRLLEAGIVPFATLNHWDMPQALEDRGGWPERQTVAAFADYAEAVAARLGDRLRHWATHNEPWCVATLGYEEGKHAPGRRSPAEALRAGHHLLLSHARAASAIRGRVSGAEVGIVLNLSPACPATESEADREAARRFDGLFNRWYLDPLFRGRYPADAVADRVRRGHLAGPELPFVREGDLAEIAVPLDWLGVNYYSRTPVRAGPAGEPVGSPLVPVEELTDMGWEIYPQGLTDTLLRVAREYAPPAVYVTENGAAFPDEVAADGRVLDPRRVDYLHRHAAAAWRAIAAGVPLRGYFVWSLLDNFEWDNGFTKRFGLFRVDFASFERTPKQSAFWYRDVVAANAVEDRT